MARRADLGNLGEDGILVAVRREGFHILEMSACLAFHPKFIPASAVVSHFTCFQCHIIRFLVHICHHQHFVGLIILHDHSHMPVAVQLKLFPWNRRIKGIYGDIIILAQRFDSQKFLGVLVDGIARNTADIVV